MTIYETMRSVINGYTVSGLSASDNLEFREILRNILLSDESVAAIEALAAECPPEMVGEAVEMTAGEIAKDLVEILGDVPQVAVIKTAIAAVLAAALSVTAR